MASQGFLHAGKSAPLSGEVANGSWGTTDVPAATRISLLRKFRMCAFQAWPRASPPSVEGTLYLGR